MPVLAIGFKGNGFNLMNGESISYPPKFQGLLYPSATQKPPRNQGLHLIKPIALMAIHFASGLASAKTPKVTHF